MGRVILWSVTCLVGSKRPAGKGDNGEEERKEEVEEEKREDRGRK